MNPTIRIPHQRQARLPPKKLETRRALRSSRILSKAWSSFRSYYRVSYVSSALATLGQHSPQRLHHSHVSTASADTLMKSIHAVTKREYRLYAPTHNFGGKVCFVLYSDPNCKGEPLYDAPHTFCGDGSCCMSEFERPVQAWRVISNTFSTQGSALQVSVSSLCPL